MLYIVLISIIALIIYAVVKWWNNIEEPVEGWGGDPIHNLMAKAKEGNAEACFELARAFDDEEYKKWKYNGHRQINHETAFKFCMKAAELGHADAMFYLSLFSNPDNGGFISIKDAIAWVEKAAENGSIPGLITLGQEYEQGLRGRIKDLNKAKDYYHKAIEAYQKQGDGGDWSANAAEEGLQRISVEETLSTM